MGFYYVYILRSKKDLPLYTGFTNNIERRLREHHQGKTHSTKHRRPLELIYYEAHILKQTAMRRENYLKTTKGKTYIKIVLKEALSK